MADDAVSVLVDGYAYGSLSMTAYTLGLRCPTSSYVPLDRPHPPPQAPADGTNI